MWNKIALQLGLPFILISSFGLSLKALLQTPYANGWDSYFYLVQVKALIEEGQMHSSDASLIYPLMLGLQFIFKDYVLSYKITTTLLSTTFTGLVFIFVWKKTNAQSWAFLAAAFTVFSPQLTFFAAQYPKNLLGLVLFLGFLMSLAQRKWIWIVILLILNYFGHRMTMGLCLVLGATYLFFNLLQNTQERFKWDHKSWLIGLSLLGLIALSFILPGLLNLADVERLEGLLGKQAHFSTYSFWQIMEEGNRLSIFWKGELVLTNLLFFGMLPYLFFKSSSTLGKAIICSLLFLVFPYFEWSQTGFSYRFFLVFILLIPLLISFLPNYYFKQNSIPLSLGLLFLGLSFLSYTSYDPSKHDANYKLYDRITEKALEKLPIQPELVIAHNALAEYFTFTSGFDAMPWLPEYQIPEDRLWRIATDIRFSEFQALMPPEKEDQVYRLSVNYFLVQEDLWQKVLGKLKQESDDALFQHLNTWRNPHKIRPAYLLKNQ